MAKRKTKSKSKAKTASRAKGPSKKLSFKLSSQQKLIFGSLLIILGILMFIAFLSYFFTGAADQSTITQFSERDIETENWLNKIGAWVSETFIHKGFGVASFIFSGLLFLSGIYVTLDIPKSRLQRHWIWGTLIVIWLSIFFGFFSHKYDVLGGTVGFEMNSFLQDYLGKIGTSALLAFILIVYLAIRFKVTGQTFVNLFKSAKKDLKSDFKTSEDNEFVGLDNNLSEEAEAIKAALDLNFEKQQPEDKHSAKETITKEPKKVPKVEISEPKKEEAELDIE
ncbi:MAG: DNA translocase FtsK 4TM domain-containing protein, partial [Bacteroidota bacterium]